MSICPEASERRRGPLWIAEHSTRTSPRLVTWLPNRAQTSPSTTPYRLATPHHPGTDDGAGSPTGRGVRRPRTACRRRIQPSEVRALTWAMATGTRTSLPFTTTGQQRLDAAGVVRRQVGPLLQRQRQRPRRSQAHLHPAAPCSWTAPTTRRAFAHRAESWLAARRLPCSSPAVGRKPTQR
jgi:hypothetical protein